MHPDLILQKKTWLSTEQFSFSFQFLFVQGNSFAFLNWENVYNAEILTLANTLVTDIA